MFWHIFLICFVMESLLEVSDSLLHWQESPSVVDRDKNYQNILFSTITSARSSNLLKLSTIYRDSEIFRNNAKELIRTSEADPIPLFQQISASIIQVVTNSIQNLLSNPEIYLENFLEYFKENPMHNGIFGYLTFPSLCFYFMTNDFLEIGKKCILETIKYDDGFLPLYLCAGFFDSITNFQKLIWETFNENISNDQSILNVFLYSLDKGLCIISKQHSELIDYLIENNKKFFLNFFFSYYFPLNLTAFFAEYSNCIESEACISLNEIFKFVYNNPDSALTELIISAFKTDKKSSLFSPVINYMDMNLQTVHAVISGAELNILFQAFKNCDMIKKNSKVASLVIPNESKVSLMPGLIQFSYRKFITLQKNEVSPLIFSTEEIESIPNKNNMKNKKREKSKDLFNQEINSSNEYLIDEEESKEENSNKSTYKRSWAELLKLSKEEGQTTPMKLLLKPTTPQIKNTLSRLDKLNSDDFKEYIIEKMKKRISKSKQKFEKYIAWISTQDILIKTREKYKENSKCSIFAVARDTILADYFSNDTFEELHKEEYINTPLYDLFTLNVLNPKQKITYTSINMERALNSQINFESSVSSLIPLKPPTIYAFASALELANFWEKGKESDEGLLNTFRAFLIYQRWKIISQYNGEIDKVIKEKKTTDIYIKIAENIRKLKNLSISSRVTGLTEQLFNIYSIESSFTEIDLASFAEVATDIMIYSGREDFIIEFIWLERIAVLIFDSVVKYKPYTRQLWAALLGNIGKRLEVFDNKMYGTIAEAISVMPNYHFSQ